MDKELKIKISIDKNTGNIAVVNREFDGLSSSINQSSKNSDAFTARLKDMAHAGVGVYALKQGVDGLTNSFNLLMRTAGEFETQKTILKTLEGDSIKAEKSVEWIKNFAATTPYEMKNVTDAFLKAKSYGIDPMNGSLKALGDAAAGMGKDLTQAVEAMADATTGENERLKEFGITAKVTGEKVKYSWMTTSGEARDIVVANNAKVIQSTLESIFNSKYKDAMLDQMNTWKGITSNFSDTLDSALNDFAVKSGIFESAKTVVTEYTASLKTLSSEMFISNNNSKAYSDILTDSIPLIEGVATATAVMFTASKSASIYEALRTISITASSEAMAINTEISRLKTAMEIADAEALRLGAYAQTARTLANEASTVAMKTHSVFAIEHSNLLAIEAKNAEAAAIAQTAHARALLVAGIASAGTATSVGLLGTAMKGVPFLAIASTVAILATSFFDAKKESDELNKSLDQTAETLAKLTTNQLAYREISLASSLQTINEDIQKATPASKGFSYGDVIGLGLTAEEKAKAKSDLDYLIQQKKDIQKALQDVKDAKEGRDINALFNNVTNVPNIEKKDFGNKPTKDITDAQKKAIDDQKKLKEDWAKENLKLDLETATLQQDILVKPFLELSAKYDEDLVKYGTSQGAKEKLDIAYNAKLEQLNKDIILKRNQDEFKAYEEAQSAVKTFNDGQITAKVDYYNAIGDSASSYYLEEEQKMKKLAETGWYSNEQMLAIKTADNEKFQKEQWAKDNAFWVGLFDNINKAMDDQFFNAMTGKFTSFGNWLQDFWSSITQSMARGLSKSLADSILGTGKDEGGVQNIFKSFGGFGGLLGTSTSALASIQGASGSVVKDGLTTTAGGTVIDSTGLITTAGSDVSSIVNSLSSAKSAYSLATNGLNSMLLAPSAMMGQLAGTAYGAGFTGTGSFLAGGANVLGGGGASGLTGSALAGGLATAGLAGGIGGYALGSLGDSLFGANTKASTGGAVGGALGAMIGSVVPVLGTFVGGAIGSALGSLIGGAFGSTTKKVTGSGVQFWEGANAQSDINASSYTDIEKKSKSWFSSSTKRYTTYAGLSAKDIKNIEKTFDTYDYLLMQLGSSAKTYINAGKYSGASFQDVMAKSFITGFVGATDATLATIYTTWVDYAGSINKTVAEAMTTSVGSYITTTRSFNEWSLGSGTTEQLKFTADYLTKDFNLLASSMGASGVTVENYLSEYDKAIKTSFTAETIDSWKNLGSALMGATDANTKYADSLKSLSKIAMPKDMMLQKTNDVTSITGGTDGTVTLQMLETLQRILREFQTQTKIAQLSSGV